MIPKGNLNYLIEERAFGQKISNNPFGKLILQTLLYAGTYEHKYSLTF